MSFIANLYRSFGLKQYVQLVKEAENRRMVKKGALALSVLTGSLAYFIYSKQKMTEEKVSEYLFNLSGPSKNINLMHYLAPNLSYSNLLASIDKVSYEKMFFMKPCKVTGYFDHSKEIHVLCEKYGQKGFLVFTPFYYANYKDYEIKEVNDPEKRLKNDSQQGTIVVNRGW